MKTYEEIETILAPWTPEFMDAAQREGWDLFTTSDSTSDVQVQRIDDPEELPSGAATHLPSDAAAMCIVRGGTGAHHCVARQIISTHFPAEWDLMEKAYAELVLRP